MAFSLLFGTLFVPARQAQAGFLSGLFGDQVYAETSASPDVNSLKSSPTPDNSQNITLPQANVSPDSILQNKDKKNDPINDSTDDKSNIISDTALLSSAGPLGVSDGTADTSPDDTSVYVVRKGDTFSEIADLFGVSVNTILWANGLKKGDKPIPGDVLLILPVSGVEHTVAKGQTLETIAKLYKADVNDIAMYNGIPQGAKLAVGDKILIPDGEMADEGGDKPAPNLKAKEVKDKNYYATSLLKNIVGYFIDPVPTGHKTQGLHGPGFRGIDIGAPTGTNIYASAPGTVIAVHTGCKVVQKRCGGGYGNMEIIQHDNGTKTLYGHMTKVLTTPGTRVARGEIIGLVGSTGRSTGPHLHFEVFNAKNPGADWSWAN